MNLFFVNPSGFVYFSKPKHKTLIVLRSIQVDPMLPAHPPFLILGGLIALFPITTISARSEFPYSDGSTCFQCTGSDAGSQACAPEFFVPGACGGRACDGTYYLGDYEDQELKRDSTRVPFSKNKCLFRAQVYSYGSEELSSTEECCFKPGSPVRFSPISHALFPLIQLSRLRMCGSC